MKIKSLHIRGFRSIAGASLLDCGDLNVLIGKNNAGKSNILNTITIIASHLRQGSLASTWHVDRPKDEFTDRDILKPLQIGIEFELTKIIAHELCDRLKSESPHLERSIEQIPGGQTIAIILSGTVISSSPFLFTQEISVGQVEPSEHGLTSTGIKLLSVPIEAAHELYKIRSEIESHQTELNQLENIFSERGRLSYLFEDKGPRFPLHYLFDRAGEQPSASLVRRVEQIFERSKDVTEFTTNVQQLVAVARNAIEQLTNKEITTPISAFAGATRVSPAYAAWLMQKYGSLRLLHLKENKQPIGREEAKQLLSLKVRRGGPDKLRVVQTTVEALLGVKVDAFEADSTRRERQAEMDVDDFLVEANGAGIREALRLILDLELKEPQLVLIEEPEVHLHPGLEHAVHAYLRNKSQNMQMFVTTHSTNFVDSISFQNIYLVSRGTDKRTMCDVVSKSQDLVKIPAELGLRLSTVFMYDRLVFVEGPSDEAVFRELASKLMVDIAKANVGFVQMGGVRNFAHYAAEGTLDLLARRQIKMWFVADRDELEDEEVRRMQQRLGERATLDVLQRREIENYLLDPAAVTELLAEKCLGAGVSTRPKTEDVQAHLKSVATALKDEVLRLRLERRVLRPIFLLKRDILGKPEERLKAGMLELQGRLAELEAEHSRLEKEIAGVWPAKAMDLAPGSMILDGVAKKYSMRFSKDSGDSARLAHLLQKNSIPRDLGELMRRIVE